MSKIKKLPVKLSEENEFFIALCYEPIKPVLSHSLILIGVKDKSNKQVYILNACGKYLDMQDKHAARCGLLETLFRPIPAKLCEENALYHKNAISLQYKAFSITPEQYLDYLELVSHCKRTPYFGAYHEVEHNHVQKIYVYEYEQFNEKLSIYPDSFNDKVKSLSMFNTCRHAATHILDHIIGKISGISRFFLSPLPHTFTAYQGRIHGDVYIYPTPPCQTQHTKDEFIILSKIYQQMTKVATSHRSNPNTLNKFESLKTLYLSLNRSKPFERMQEMFDIIAKWDSVNKEVIDKKRGFSLFKSTATRQLIHEVSKLNSNVNVRKYFS